MNSNKIDDTLAIIKKSLIDKTNPVVLCSFGKDSMVLLDIVRRARPQIDVMFFKEPFQHRKYTHAERVISDLNLTIYDYPPSYTNYVQNGDWFDVLTYRWLNGRDWLIMPVGCSGVSDGTKALCVVRDLIGQPRVGRYEFRWDLVFTGYKQFDNDNEFIHAKLGTKDRRLETVRSLGNIVSVLPLIDWTDDEVWGYIEEFNVPFCRERYELGKNEFNDDKFYACANCLDYRFRGENVRCERTGDLIKSVAGTEEDHRAYLKKIALL